MGLIKEPLDVDFVVDLRPLTKEEELAISEFIRKDKEKRRLQELRKARGKAAPKANNQPEKSTNRQRSIAKSGA